MVPHVRLLESDVHLMRGSLAIHLSWSRTFDSASACTFDCNSPGTSNCGGSCCNEASCNGRVPRRKSRGYLSLAWRRQERRDQAMGCGRKWPLVVVLPACSRLAANSPGD